MTEPTFDWVASIAAHSNGFAAAATGHLDARVEHCPAWSVADLVWHLTEVHWFWATIAGERLAEPPAAERRPVRSADNTLLDRFRAGADHLTRVLSDTPGSDPAWTWAPTQQNVGFIARHQVQEAAVHHWDAAHAAGVAAPIAAIEGADAVEEFLTFSLSTDTDPADPPRPALDGRFAMSCNDLDRAWLVHDGRSAGTVGFADLRDGAPADAASLEAPAAQLLLWLYGRVAIDPGPVDVDLLARFRALAFTD